MTTTTTHGASARWVPFALVALSLAPAIAGSLRLAGLMGGPQLMPADARIEALPLPVIVHIVSVIPYSLLGRSSSPRSCARVVRPGTGRRDGCWCRWRWRWPSAGCG